MYEKLDLFSNDVKTFDREPPYNTVIAQEPFRSVLEITISQKDRLLIEDIYENEDNIILNDILLLSIR